MGYHRTFPPLINLGKYFGPIGQEIASFLECSVPIFNLPEEKLQPGNFSPPAKPNFSFQICSFSILKYADIGATSLILPGLLLYFL